MAKHTRILYVANYRMPTPKAHGIQVAKACEAIVEAGISLTLIIPKSKVWSDKSVSEFYELRTPVPTRVIASPDFYGSGGAGYLFSTFCFAVAALTHLLASVPRKGTVVYARPDPFFLPLALLCGFTCVAEVHDAYIPGPFMRAMLKRTKAVVATNTVIRDAVAKSCSVLLEKFHVEANGVDVALFTAAPDKHTARTKLALPAQARVALYLGRFYDWKGLDVLPEAARLAPDIAWYAVGGDEAKFKKVTATTELPPNLFIHEGCAAREVPGWLAAADVLLTLGTKKNETSYRYTTPLKTYEYMAAERPVVAAATLAMKDVIAPGFALFYEPDDAQSLVEAVRKATANGPEIENMTAGALRAAAEHSWDKRAARILAFVGA